MGALDHTAATLRLYGDDLDPAEITRLLGASPTQAFRKGDDFSRTPGKVRIAKRGTWRLEAARREPGDLESQVFELLDQVTSDPAIWKAVSRYEPDLFCGLFMAGWNDGLSLSPKALLALAERGIELTLDIYSHEDFPDPAD